MATSLTANVNVNVKATLVNADFDIGQANFSFNESFAQAFAQGTGINQANQVWTDTRSIGSSANDDLDLAAGLTNALGTSITFTSIKAIIVKAAVANANNLIMGGEGAAAFETMFGLADSTLIIAPGGTLALVNPNATGYVVTPTTADILRFTNAGSGAISYDVIFIGETA